MCKWVVAKRIFLIRQSSIIIWSFEGARLSRSVRVFLKMDDLNSSRIFWSNPISLLELNLDKRLGNEEPTHPFIKKAHLKKCYVNVAYFHFLSTRIYFSCLYIFVTFITIIIIIIIILSELVKFDHYRDTRAAILDPCIQEIFLLLAACISKKWVYFIYVHES